ncbi:SAM-dependent methyltransferase [Vibrio sp. ZSDE26]|uniref:SAM-dependent methyltransferase n=1 Tax=Vibrio amylolyticus TaxID=2847292 RepID=A0A9X1XFE1_9VIBR|nr:methyltransferase [Vibrio amylolyticus]MCK6261987.1 SAM-dependent methyltransferase [Vibrio amylolyticus]
MQNHFKELDQFILNHQQFWRTEPFHHSFCSDYPWDDSHPNLSTWLDSLTNTEIEAYKVDTSKLTHSLSSFFPELNSITSLISLPALEAHEFDFSSHLFRGIPGRKLEQILAMGHASVNSHYGSEWLEWCSGKGYLGRVLAASSGQKVTSLEYQGALCESGQRGANSLELPISFVQGDALSEKALSIMTPDQHAVALHACGDLHSSLLYKASQLELPAITISPCCYHLIQGDHYQPMSQSGQSSQLTLSKHDLRIPLQETVTGGERVKRHRFQEMSYRLGFDLMLRELGLTDEYIPIPSIKKSQLSLGFESFCNWATNLKLIDLPDVNFEEYQLRGEARFWQMERISLIQQLFRRPLEMWLVLDKALYLQERGYQVTLSQFCPREMTPRNILLHAYRN